MLLIHTSNTNKNEPLRFKPIIKIIVKKQITKYSGVICFCEQVVREGDLTARESIRGRDHFDFW